MLEKLAICFYVGGYYLYYLLKILLILLLLQFIVYNITLHKINPYKIIKKYYNKIFNYLISLD